MLNPSFVIVLATIMINMMGVGLVWPILPKLVEELTGGTLSEVSAVYTATVVVFSIMQFAVAPLMGILSDRFGRKPIMLFSLAALGVDYLLLAIAPSMIWMFIARSVAGAFAATFSIANAYVADTMEPDKRAGGFGLIGAAFGLGFIVGPVIGGFLGEIDLRLPFWFAASVSFLNVVFGAMFMRESLPPEKRRKRGLIQSNPFSSVRWMFKKPMLFLMAVILLLANTMQRGLESIFVLFTQHQYGWGMADAGISLAIVGVCFVVVQGFLAGKIIPMFGERNVIVWGLGVSSMFYFVMAFNRLSWIGFVGIVPHVSGWALASTAIQSFASRQVEADSQGYLQGAITGLGGLSAIFGPILAGSSFSWFTSQNAPFHFPGAFFVLAGGVLVLSSLLAGRHMANEASPKFCASK